MKSSTEYRKMAELCRRHAEELGNDNRDRARWLRIAEGWMVLARDSARGASMTTARKSLHRSPALLPIAFEQRA
jgi:hypothetical protein